jgi:tRNA U34 5-methylaminomethyl-2-thiouridine-forming methyltransferase MnmC
MINQVSTKVIITQDGSPTLHHASLDETYHSSFGAVQESEHVFLSYGYRSTGNIDSLCLLEMGFGTGLNAWLTARAAQEEKRLVYYETIELYPLPLETLNDFLSNLDIDEEDRKLFESIHRAPWNEVVELTSYFRLHKVNKSILDWTSDQQFHLVYFDAFSPEKQPDLWTASIFSILSRHMLPGAMLTTYCAKGQVRRNLQEAGFRVERLPGPPGKREMLRAKKPYPVTIDRDNHEADQG